MHPWTWRMEMDYERLEGDIEGFKELRGGGVLSEKGCVGSLWR
jgi:hypothetical protein